MKVTITKLVNNVAVEHSVEGTHEEIAKMLVFLELAEYANRGVLGAYTKETDGERVIPLERNDEGFLSTKINLDNINDQITVEDIRGFRTKPFNGRFGEGKQLEAFYDWVQAMYIGHKMKATIQNVIKEEKRPGGLLSFK